MASGGMSLRVFPRAEVPGPAAGSALEGFVAQLVGAAAQRASDNGARTILPGHMWAPAVMQRSGTMGYRSCHHVSAELSCTGCACRRPAACSCHR